MHLLSCIFTKFLLHYKLAPTVYFLQNIKYVILELITFAKKEFHFSVEIKVSSRMNDM